VLIKTSTILAVLAISALCFGAEYENFDLPSTGGKASVPDSKLSYTSSRVRIRGGKVKLKEPSINHQLFVFAKEAYITEKRDEAIKLLRQEMDSKLVRNKDNMLMRLGQLYAEKYMELSYRENEYFALTVDEYEKIKSARPGSKPPTLDNSRSQRYLKQALDIFYSLEREFPNHPKIDEVVYFIGFVELEGRNAKKGVTYLQRVVNTYPRSRKWDEAVLYLGDHYFDNQKFPEAANLYRKLAARESSLRDYSEYKLAWCELNTGDAKRALRQMKSFVVRLATTADQGKFNLRDQAMKDLVIFYGETELVDDAMSFFTERQGKDKALENLRLIADIFRAKGRDEGAVRAYQRLLSEFPDSLDAPRLALGLYDSESRLGRVDKAVKHVIAAVEKYGATSEWAKSFPSEKASDLKATIETLQAEALKVAFYHHNAAQKSANKTHYDYAMKIYSALLSNFPEHPDRKKIAFYQGEAQFNQGRWANAASAYLLAAKTAPKDKLSEEAAYNALLAVDKLSAKSTKLERYTKEEQKKIDTTPKDIPEGEEKFIEVGEFYLKEYPQGAKAVDVKFRVAGIYYTYHHFDRALETYKGIALSHPSHRSATTAAHIALDIHNIRKDYDTMLETAAIFANTKALGDKKFRDEIAGITSEVDFKRIEPLEKDNKWVQAGDNYLSFFQKNPNSALAEKSLYNAYISYEKAGELVKSSQAVNLFITKFPKSDYTPKLTLAQAKSAEKMYDFEQAQKLYADFYRRHPNDREAKKALYNAAVLAELLEKNKEAIALYNDHMKVESPSREEKRAIWISQAKLYRKEGNWEKMASTYRQLIRDARNVEERLNFLGEMARQYDKAGRMREKGDVLGEIKALAGNLKGPKLGLAAPYFAETKLKALEKQREKYASIKLRFPPEDLVYLLKTKERHLVKLAKAYDEIVEIGVPEWGVAALFEKGQAYDDFVKTYRLVEIPKRYKGEEREVVAKALKDIDAKMVQPLELKTQEILKACASRAAEFKVVNEYAGNCRSRIKRQEGEAEPTGLMPQPSYWSTKYISSEIARK
jgi:TolA-binding protein